MEAPEEALEGSIPFEGAMRGPYGALEFHEESLHVGNIEKV